MTTLMLVLLILVVGWKLWYVEEHDQTENRMISRMVKKDIKAQRKRGDIVKEVKTRGY